MEKSTKQNGSPQSGTMNQSSPQGRASKQGTSWFRKSISRFAVILLLAFLMTNAKAQVNIPDNNFFNYLVNTLGFIDLGPNQIYDIQAEFYDSPLNVDSLGIADLTGIQAFTSLTSLNCNGNSLTSLDVSQNTALTYLDCGSNALTSLDVSHNTALQNLRCQHNSLTSLDMSNNPALTAINCSSNNLSSLNLANGNNGNMVVNNSGSFGTYNNPNLECITVDNAAYSNIYWYHWVDSWTSFSLNCGITCSETVNIPDPAFLAFCLANFDTNHDGVIQVCEAQAVRGDMPLTQLGISDLTGIQAFTNIQYLECDGNSLSSLDVSQNTALTFLNCSGNALTSLDVSTNTVLGGLYCNNNTISSLNVSNNTALEYFYCDYNFLSSLDVSHCTALVWFVCNNNNLNSLDVSNCQLLQTLDCNDNSLNSLDVSHNTALVNLWCYDNPINNLNLTNCPDLDYLICYNNNLMILDLSNNPALEILWCNNNNLSNLDVSSNTALYDLLCGYNPLNGLDVSHNTALGYLECWNDGLTSLDVSHNTDLIFLYCWNNSLSSLDVSNNINMTALLCYGNQLSSLDVSHNTALGDFRCNNNNLTSLDISHNTGLGNLQCDHNSLTSLDVSHNSHLADLFCNDNSLTSLNVSNNTMIYFLYCYDNSIRNLDLSNDTALYFLYCQNNNLLSLNIANGRNSTLDSINATGNPSLSCIQVDNIPYSTTNWNSYVDNTSSFNTTCPCSQIVNIPDPIFKAYCLANFDSNNDGEIEICEAEAVNEMAPAFQDISDYTGIEAFTNLTYFDCQNNFSLTNLDVSHNTLLVFLSCWENSISSLDLSQNILLQTLRCNDNSLSRLDLSNNTALIELNCGYNNLTNLNVSNNTALTSFQCYSNNISSLDVSHNPDITYFICSNNNLNSLNAANGNNIIMTTDNFNANNNPNLNCIQVDNVAYSDANWSTDIDNTATFSTNCACISTIFIPDPIFKAYLIGRLDINTNGDGEIQYCEAVAFTGTIDVSSLGVSDLTGIEVFTNLTGLVCHDNNITSLNVSSNTALTSLYCSYNQLGSLDVSNNAALTGLYCWNCNLTSLDLSNNPVLNSLLCYNNAFGTLDVSNNSALSVIDAHGCSLNSLDVSHNPALNELYCFVNNLNSLDISQNPAITELLCSVNTISTLDVSHNPVLVDLECENNALISLNVANGNNINFTTFNALNNPNLQCIQVDDITYSDANWSADIDNNASFSTNCACIWNPPVPPVITANGNTTFCEGGSVNLYAGVYTSYNWNTNENTEMITASSNGNYSVTVTSANGCTGMASQAVTVNPNPTPSINANGNTTFCQGGSVILSTGTYPFYNWNTNANTQSITESTSGTYSVTVTDGNGCTGIASQDVVVNSNPNPTITSNGPTTFCQGGSVMLSTDTYSSYLWNTNDITSSISASSSDNYSVTVTDVNGCVGNATQIVTVNALPTVNAGDVSGCSGSTIALSGSPAGGTWNVANPYSNVIAGSYSYTYSFTDGNGCMNNATSNITVNALPTVSAGNVSGCAGSNITLIGSPAGGTWSVTNPYTNIAGNYSYNYNYTDGNGCSNNAASNITVNPNPSPTITANGPTTFCQGGSVIFNTGTYSSYLWNTNAITPSINASTSGNYSVTVTDANGCIGNSVALSVTVNPNPTVTITGPSSICNGNTIALTSTALTSYIWSTGAVTHSINVNNSGTYKVTATNANGCTGTASQIVVTTTLTTPVITGPTTTCIGNPVTLGITNTYSTYSWSTGAITPTISVNSTGLYGVTVTSGNCTGSTHLSVTVFPLPNPVIIGTGLTTYCEGGDAILSVASFQTYHWNTGANTQSLTVLPGNPGIYTVTVTNTNGCSAVGSYPLNSTCSLPSQLSISNIAATSAFATWVPPSCVYGYTIRISKHNANAWTNYTIAPNSHYTFSQLAINTNYDVQIQSNCNASGSINSGFSATQTFTTLARLESGETDNIDYAFNIYPNPTNDHATVAFTTDTEDVYLIRLIDVTGRIIQASNYTSIIGENQYQLNLSTVDKGVYTVILQNGTTLLQSKIVVQ